MMAQIVALAVAVSSLPPVVVAHSTTLAPQWERLPSSATLDRLFPRQAKKDKVGGRTWMRCGVDANGKLQNCAVIKEIPESQGFGEAALQSVRYFKMKPRMGGVSVGGGTVIIPIVWQTRSGAKPPPLPPEINPATGYPSP
jgi:TonB family protein